MQIGINLSLSQRWPYGAGPSLDLNFLSGILDPRITFTRGSAGTRINALGQIESVGDNLPRFDYDPVTLQPKGLLVEGQRTNLLVNALLNGTALNTQSVTVTAQAYTLSFYGSGSITLSGAHSATVTGDGVYPSRKTLTFTPTAGTLTLTVSGTVQFAQLEAGAYATSFTPTAGSQATRTADTAIIDGERFSRWFNPLEGAFVVDFFSGGTSSAISAEDTTNNNFMRLGRSANSPRMRVYSGGVEQVVFTPANPTGLMAPAKVSGAYKAGDFAVSCNGGTVMTASSGVLPISPSQLRIGTSGGGDPINNTIRRLRYWPRRLTNAQLQELTT
jgi:hypothetical protein